MARERERAEERLEECERVCRESGVKVTPQRMEIFRELLRSEEHPDAEAVHRAVRERLPTISLDTVYRTLWLLSDLGLIRTMGHARERTRFDANLDRHHHFVCVRCGLTRDFHSDALDGLSLPREVRAFGRVEETHVEVRGVCGSCAAEK